MRQLHDQALVEDRSGAWRIRLVIGFCWPFCDRIVHARDVDHAYGRLRFVCQHCCRDLIEIECAGGGRG
jgi:hypothetical protein